MIPGGSSPTRKLSSDEIYRPMTWNFVGIFPRHSRNTASQVGHLPGSRLLRKWSLSYSFLKQKPQSLSSVPVWAEPSQLLLGMWHSVPPWRGPVSDKTSCAVGAPPRMKIEFSGLVRGDWSVCD